jgi:ubiquilin
MSSVLFSAENPQQGTENRNPLPNPWGGSQQNTNRPPLGILNTPAMQSLLQQMSESPTLMQNMMNAPYTRNMLEAMQADPNMAANVSVWKLNIALRID